MVSYTPTTARVCITVALVLATVSLGIVLGADPSTNGPSATGASIAGGADPYLTKHLPLSEPRNGYVSSGACVSCHPKEHASWRASYHSTMTQIATPETIIGDFNNVRLESRGLVYNLKRRGDEFWVEMADPDVDWANRFDEMNRRITRRNPPLPRTKTRVILTTGSHHMQTYWVASNSGREVRNLPFLYLIEDQRWVPREDAFIRPPDSGRMMGDWNSVCLRCHTTGPNPKYDFATKTLDTEVIELGIACEACHGPGAAHVIANQDPARRQRFELGIEPDPTILHPKRVSSKVSTQVCGQCHGIYSVYDPSDFAVHGFRYRPGDELENTRYYLRHKSNETQPARPETFTPTDAYIEHYYWPDGMVRSSGREYQGLTESPCYLRGNISCVSCHTMHEGDRDDQLNPAMRGNRACLQCHESFAAELTEHTHHPPDSPGSNCYNCHMPHTSYGLYKAIRSHQISSPSVRSSVEAGRPNGCNLCHLDRTLQWTAEHLTNWYGQPVVTLSDDQRSISAALLWLLRGDAVQRAIIAWVMGWEPAQQASGSDWLPAYLSFLLQDPYSAVRYIAYHSLKRLPGFGELEYDFIGPEKDRRRVGLETLRTWTQEHSHKLSRSGPDILIRADGTMMSEDVVRILMQRDDRRLFVAE